MNERVAVRPEEFEIKRAERKQAKLRLAVAAASGGGKTWTSLEVAFGIVEQLIARGILTGRVEGKVGLVDTERKSSQLYAHLGPFDTIELGPPHSVERYIGAMQALERAGCVVIVLDSISHAWVGDGGVLSILNRFNAGERFSAFGTDVNPAQDKFIDAMLKSPAHVIATMRSKTAWVLEDRQNRSGHMVKTPRRIGMAPIQRPGIEFEFTTLVDLDTETHVARVLKNRCPLFDDWQPKKLTREHGRQLVDWLLEGAPEPKEPVSGTPAERAQATAEAAERACMRAATLPDLQRIYVESIENLKSFSGAVDALALVSLRDRVVNAKDARKGELGAPSSVTTITPDDAIDLEDMLRKAKWPPEEFLAKVGVKRLALLPAVQLRGILYEIQGEALARMCEEPPAIPERLQAKLGLKKPPAPGSKKTDAFDDFADDIPWKP